MNGVGASLAEHFGTLADPRAKHLTDHKLLEVIIIAMCGVICGAETGTDVELFGNERLAWLRQFLELKHGIPSHDTFGRVFARRDAEAFEARFAGWVQAVFQVTKGQVVAVDGKSARRSHDRRQGKEAIHVVSAWATANHLVLGQRTVAEKSNEIKAIPELLRLLDVRGCIVTIDAMGCQDDIAEQIVKQKADYVLAVKNNQPHLLEDIELFFRLAQQNDFQKVDASYERRVNKGHGRIEIRECWAIAGPDSLQFLRDYDRWQGLQTMAMVTSQRQVNGQSATETRYYISSLPNDAATLLEAVRGHWGVENALHWVLDVAMGEDV